MKMNTNMNLTTNMKSPGKARNVGLSHASTRTCLALVLGVGLFCLFGLACTVPFSQVLVLPEDPIAFMHWSTGDAKKRAKVFENAAGLPPLPESREADGRLQAADLRAYLRGEQSLGVHQRLAEVPGRLMLFWPATGEATRLEAAPLGSRPLAWSADRKRLLFTSAHRGGKMQLYEYDLEGEVLMPLTSGPDEFARGDYERSGAVVALRGERSSVSAAKDWNAYRLGSGGRLAEEIARAIPPGTLRATPLGDRLIYEQVVARPRRSGAILYESFVATQPTDGGSEVLLGRGREPTLTPDGEWVVFASLSSAGYRLRRMRPDGTARVPISPGGSEERMPSVSPDGEYVVFVQMLNGYRKLAVRRFDGKGEKRLFTDGWSEFPVW